MANKILSVFLIVAISLNLTACNTDKKKRYEAEFLELFDTVTKIVAYTDSKEEFAKQSQFIQSKLKEYHQLYDIYNDYKGITNIKTINDNAGKKPVKVDKKIIDLLVFSKNVYKVTGGKTNVAMGAVLRIWHDYRTSGIDDPENAKLPPMSDLKEAAKHTDINKLIIDEKNSTVFLKDPKMSIDVGAVAKGYATEMVCDAAKQNGFESGLVSVGGNVKAIGKKGDKLWNVGIQNPDLKGEQNLKIVYISDKSLVTSGNYQRYYTVNGNRYNHIIRPDTLMPAEYFASVSIVTEHSGLADALSTAVFNMPYEQGLKLIDSLQFAEAAWVFNNGDIKYSKDFSKYLKNQ